MSLEVIVLLVTTSVDGPDFCAAALDSEAVSKLVPSIYCNIGTMVKEGKVIENNIKAIRDNHRKIAPYR